MVESIGNIGFVWWEDGEIFVIPIYYHVCNYGCRCIRTLVCSTFKVLVSQETKLPVRICQFRLLPNFSVLQIWNQLLERKEEMANLHLRNHWLLCNVFTLGGWSRNTEMTMRFFLDQIIQLHECSAVCATCCAYNALVFPRRCSGIWSWTRCSIRLQLWRNCVKGITCIQIRIPWYVLVRGRIFALLRLVRYAVIH